MQNFQGKIAVITGAGSGIGRALALQLAKEGATVVLNDWHQNTLLETTAAGGRASGQAFSVADREEMYQFAEDTVAKYGQVDIVVNNAGIALTEQKLETVDYPDFEKLLGINLWGVIYGTKAFLPHLKTRPEAALVNISSIFGMAAYPDLGPYVTAKFAVRGFTETLRIELAKTKVKVHCVHPGGIKTNIVNNIETADLKSKERLARTFDRLAPTTPATAAEVIIDGIRKGNPRILIGKDAKFVSFLAWLFPRSYEKIVMRKYDIEKHV
jgi:butyryl-CoA dehydrogenase